MRYLTAIGIIAAVGVGISPALMSWASEPLIVLAKSAKPRPIEPAVPAEVAPLSIEPGFSTDSSSGDEPISSDANTVDPKVDPDGQPAGFRALSILHIGDSHVSADFFTGEIRRRLQSRFGAGGTGYMTAGHPHSGVRSSTMKVLASPGWTYKSLQKPDAQRNRFWLSGYNAIASVPGETMSFSSDQPIEFDVVEIETVLQPGGGSIDISIDGTVVKRESLTADVIEPRVIRLFSETVDAKVKQVSIKTAASGKVQISSVSIFNRRNGLTYHSVGYVGATVGLLNKLDGKLFDNNLERINPQIVVLSFGTNEAANQNLDIGQYKDAYERAVRRIKDSVPNAKIVLIAPPDFNELSSGCRKDNVANATCQRVPADISTPGGTNVSWQVAAAMPVAAPSRKFHCTWHTPTKLAEVRDVQRDIAKREGLVYWNWGSMMSNECGAHEWFNADPPLMGRDHVHMTAEGYKRSAQQFLKTLIPVIEQVKMDLGPLSSK